MSSGGRGRLRLELDIVLEEDNDFGLEDCARLRVDRQKGVLGRKIFTYIHTFRAFSTLIGFFWGKISDRDSQAFRV